MSSCTRLRATAFDDLAVSFRAFFACDVGGRARAERRRKLLARLARRRRTRLGRLSAAEQRARMIDRDRKAERLGRAADLQRVDADHLPLAIQQRAAAVAGIDGGVGLQHHRAIGAADGADDAARDAVLEHAERQADGNDFLSGPHVVTVPSGSTG